jgi:hypothetical protein
VAALLFDGDHVVDSAPSSRISIGNTICCVPSASGVKILNLTFIEADMYIHSPRSNLHRLAFLTWACKDLQRARWALEWEIMKS